MRVGELLYRIAKHGVTLRCSRTEDHLSYSPAGALLPGLVAEGGVGVESYLRRNKARWRSVYAER